GLGGALDPVQLVAVADTIRAAERLFADVHAYPPLAARARCTRPPADVAVAIENAIGTTGEVLDRASARLGSLRANLRAAQARLQQRLDGLVHSPDLLRLLQDPIVTQRGGRYVVPVTAALAALDLILAKALYADSLQAIRPVLHADGVLDLVDARHPLLVEQGKVVGIDVQLGGDFRVLVVTGPNTGGKTVTLKTIGLLTAMAACGLAIPADRGRLPVVRRLFADIGDEQSIAQSLSTFSSHLRNVVATLAEAERGDLALPD